MLQEECAICLEPFDNGKKPRKQTYTLRCGHKFHTECIVHAFRKLGSKCPVCRDDVAEQGKSDDEDNAEAIRNILDEDDVPLHVRTLLVCSLCMLGLCYSVQRCAFGDTLRMVTFAGLFAAMFVVDDDVYRFLPQGMHIQFQIM